MFDPQSCMMQDLAPCVIEFDTPDKLSQELSHITESFYINQCELC